MAVAAPFPEHATPVDPVLVRVLGLARPLCEARGVSVAWVKWAVDHGGRVLRLTIEPTSAVTAGVREDGIDPSVSLEECAWVSRALSEVLDADEDIVPGVYSLEVSSPGIDRELVSWSDFRRFVGREVKVKLREPQPDGQRALRGKVLGVSGESPPIVEMIADEKPQRFPIINVVAAHLVVELPKLKKASEKDFEETFFSETLKESTNRRESVMKGVASMASEGLDSTIEQVAKEKGIEKRVLVETMEAAILKAAQSVFGPTRELEARYNPEIGQVDLFQYMTVVEEVAEPERQISVAEVARRKLDAELGEELGFQVFWRPEDANRAREQDREYGELLQLKQGRTTFGRIAAQNAKQVLLQRMRDAERDLIFEEYKDKKGELIRGIVRRFEKGNNILVDIGRTEGILPFKEQTPRETYRPGDRIVAYVKDIDREARGPQVILSRSDPRLVEKLFEAEVPEIYEGIVRIVGVAREPGARSKIAVTSRDTDVDPVGACVGMKGARVQAVVQELRGEKIDIVPFDRDPARYVIAAIQPAEVHKVIVDESDGRMELVVPDEKLSLAIGRKGQNVRLAAQLTQWKLNIYSVSKFGQMEEEAIGALNQMNDVTDAVAKALYRQGFRALEEISEASVEELASIQGVGNVETAERMRIEAEATIERIRLNRINEIASRAEPPTERERLLLVKGLGERTVAQLEEAGYKSVGEFLREDEDRLAIRSGLRVAKVRTLRAAAKDFLTNEKQLLADARQALGTNGAEETA